MSKKIGDIRNYFSGTKPASTSQPKSQPKSKPAAKESKRLVSPPKKPTKAAAKPPAKRPVVLSESDSDLDVRSKKKKLEESSDEEEISLRRPSRRSARVLCSDDDEAMESPKKSQTKSPQKPSQEKTKKGKSRVVLSSDEEEEEDDDYESESSTSEEELTAESEDEIKESKKKPAPKTRSRKQQVVDSDSEDDINLIKNPAAKAKAKAKAEAQAKAEAKKKVAGTQDISAFAKKVNPQQIKSQSKNATKKVETKPKVDPTDFFNNFNKNRQSTSKAEAKTTEAKPDETQRIPLAPLQTTIAVGSPTKRRPKSAVSDDYNDEIIIKSDPETSKPKKTTKTQPERSVAKKVTEIKERPKKPAVEFSSEPSVDNRSVVKLAQWVDKYAPSSMKEIIGQHTDASPSHKLLRWLRDWPRHHMGAAATKVKSKSVGPGGGDGSSFRAALLSGPPGIGKSTTAKVVCEELGLRYLELNASDARSKKYLEQKVTELLHSRRVEDFFGAAPAVVKPPVMSKTGDRVRHVLIMDEVDGMSGNADRAGIAELIQMIKKTEIPIICICNDRQSVKIRSLANYCFDLRYTKPRIEQVMARMMTILAREGVKIPKEVVESVVKASSMDLRQSIYSLQLIAAGKDAKGVISDKDTSVNIFEAARLLVSEGTTLREKRDLFFTDYSLMPLFVQENYLNIRAGKVGKQQQLKNAARAAECICIGDQISRRIRTTQNWSLLPAQGTMSCALPSLMVNGHLIAQIQFPQWFGRNSTFGKRLRIVRELSEHIGMKLTGPVHAMTVDYIPVLRREIYTPLIKDGVEAIEDVMHIFNTYEMTRDDLDLLNELGAFSEKEDPWQKVSTKTKAALTRALNRPDREQQHHYATASDVIVAPREKGAKRAAAQKAAQKISKVRKALESDDETDENPNEDNEEIHAEILDA